MALEYRKRFKQKLDKIKPDIIDDSAASSDFFNIVDIPPFLGYGKNSIRIAGSTTNLLQPNSQIQVEVIDSAGNPIYYEIPNKSYSDGSRVITIWVYNDRDNPKENTAPGMATITIIGTAKSTVPSNVSYGGSGSGSGRGRGYNESPALPPDVAASGRGRGKDRLRRRKNEPLPGKIVKWQKQIPVVIEDASPATLEFESPFIPTATVSASLRPYTNFQLETGEDPLLLGVNSKLALRTDNITVKYNASNFGTDVSLQGSTSNTFNGEMIGGQIRLDLSSKTLYPLQDRPGVEQPTQFTSSILSLSSGQIAKVKDRITGSFDHVYKYSDYTDIPAQVEYFSSASNSTTENLNSIGTFTIPQLRPSIGEVTTIQTSIKSKGIPSDFEVLAVSTVSSNRPSESITYDVVIPANHVGDPKTIKIEFLNSESVKSETFILIEDVIFPAANTFIGGKGSLISGSIFISNALGSGIELGGASSGFVRSVGFEGLTSASEGKGPGGFIIYSGSGNLTVGVDQLDGVGMQFIGDNDNSHLIFTTSGSGTLDIKAEKFFVGTPGTQFMSGSGGNN